MTIRKITGATSSLVAKVSVVTGNRIFINKATVSQTNLLATVAQDANVFKSNLILPGTVDHILYSDEGSSRFLRNLLYTPDGHQLLISKNFFDPLDLVELVGRTTFIYNAQRKVDDALLTAEEIAIIFASFRNVYDDLAITERAAKLWASRKVDAFTMLDGGIRRYINSTKRETIVMGSGLAQRQSTLENIAFLNTKLLRDTSTVTEVKQLATLQRRTDSIATTDYRQTNYWLNKYFGDSAPALDLVGVFDGNIFSFYHLVIDALNISEDSRIVLTGGRRVNDLLTISDNKNLLISKPVNEQLYATELVRKLTLQNKFEDVPALDLPRKLFIKPADNLAPAFVTVTDVSTKANLLGRFETLTAAQTRFNLLYNKPVNDAISILDLIDGYTIAWTAKRIFDELMTIAEQKAVILALRRNDAVAIGDLFGSALIKIRDEIDNVSVAETIRQYMRMTKAEIAQIDDPKAFYFRQGTRQDNVGVTDFPFIARVKAFFETLAATDSRVILAALLGKNETVPVPDASFFWLNKYFGDVSTMLDFAVTSDGAEFIDLKRFAETLTIVDFMDETRMIWRARRTFREGIFPDDYFARNFWFNKGLQDDSTPTDYFARNYWINKTADTVVPATVTIDDYKATNYWLNKIADAVVPARVILGSGIDQRQSNLERIGFVGLKTADTVVPATVTMTDYKANNYWLNKTADTVVPATVTMTDYKATNLWINKGLADTTTMLDLTGISDGLNFIWIDQETDSFFAHSYGQVSATYIRQPRDGNLSDDAVPDDYFARNNWVDKAADAVVPATVTLTDYKAQRLFTDLGKFDYPQPVDVFSRLTRTFLKPADGLRQDFTPALDNSTFSPYPARLVLLPARLGVVQTFSTAGYLTSIVTTADTKNHPVYVGQQYTGAYRAGDRLETVNNWVNIDAKQGANNALLLKTADGANNSQFSSVTVTYTPRDRDQIGTVDNYTNQILFIRRGVTGVDTSLDTGFQPVLALGSGIDQRQSNLERVSFTALMRVELDQGNRDRFDPAIVLDGSTFSPYPARVVLLTAKAGALTTVSSVNNTAASTDRLFVGQRYGNIRFSSDPMERISFLATKLLGDITTMLDLTNVFDGITYTSILIERDILTLGSGIDQRQNNLERISFTSLLRAKAGATYAVSGTTVTAPSTDRLFVGQQYGTRRLSGDPMEAMAHVVLKTALVTAGAGFYGPGSGVSVRAGTNQDPVWVGSLGTQTYAAVASNSSGAIKLTFAGALNARSPGFGTQYARIWLRRPTGYTSSVVLRYNLDENWYIDDGGGSPTTGGGGALSVTTSLTVTSSWSQYTISTNIDNWLTAAGFDPQWGGVYQVNDNSIYIETPNVGSSYDEIEVFAPWLTNNSSVSYVATFGSPAANNEINNSHAFAAAVSGSIYNHFVQPPAAFASEYLDQTRLAGPGVRREQLRYTGLKQLFDYPQAGSGFDQRQTDLERIRFTNLLRVHQDSGTFDRFDPAVVLDGSTFSPYPARGLLLDAKQGANTAVSGTTVTARDRDRLFVGQRYGNIRFSSDPMERISFLATKLLGDITTMIDLANVADGITFTGALIERDILTLGSGLGQRSSDLESIPFTVLLSAKASVTRTVSSTTATSASGDRLFVGQQYGGIRLAGDPMEALAFVTLKTTGVGGAGSSLSIVTLGSGINQRQSNLERISFYDIKSLFDYPQAGSGIDQRSTDLERISFTKLLRLHQDQGTFDRFDPAQPIDRPFKLLNLTAKRGVTGPVLLNTIDPNPDVEYQQSSVTITRTAWDLDEVGSLDYFNLTLVINRFLEDYPVFGSGIDQRQSNLERISFLMRKLIGDDQNMLDIQSLSDGLTFSYLARESDSFSMGPSANQPYPARALSGNAENIGIVNLLTAKRGQNGTVFTQTIDGVNASRTSVLVSYGSYGDDAVGTLDFRTDAVNYVRQPWHGFSDYPSMGDDSANSTFPARSLRMRIQPGVYGTNLITSSETVGLALYGEGNWVYPAISGLSITNDYVVAPDGTLTADRVAGDYIYLPQTVSPNTTYTWSWYAQVTNDRLNSFGSITPLYYRVEGNVSGVRVSDTLYSSAFTPFAWNRVSVTFTTGPSDTTVNLYPYGSPYQGSYQGWEAYYWGWQLNPGTEADAYIRTTSTAIVNSYQGLSNFVAPTDTGGRSNFVNISARRGVSGTLQFSTIGNSVENTVSSVTIVRTLRDPDAVGILDSFALFTTDKNVFGDFVTIGSGIDQRQSTLERISFVLLTRVKTDDGLGLALDPVAPVERIALQVLNRESSIAVVVGTTSGSRIAGNPLENIRFTNLLTAKRGQNGTVFTQTIEGNNSARTSVLVSYGSYGDDAVGTLDFRTDVVNYFRAPHHGFDDYPAVLDADRLTLLLRAKLDQGSQDRFDPVILGSGILGIRVAGNSLENLAMTMLLDAKRGVQGTVLLNTIDPNPDVEYQQSSIAVTYGSRQPDSVGTLDYFQLFYATNRFLQDSVLLGSGIDQRQSNTERVSFWINKRFDETPDGGQGINVGPSMLDSFSFNDGLTFTYLQTETDATPALDRSAFSPFPARLLLMPARLGVVQTFSSITTTADAKNHPVYVGTQIAANRKDVLENTFYTILKVADNSDRDTAVSIVVMTDPARPPQAMLKRAVQDSGTFDRFDPTLALDNSTFSPYPARVMLLDAKRALTGNIELKTIDSFGDNAYSSVQVTYTSRDRDLVGSIDRASLVFTAGRILQELVTIGSGIDQRQSNLERISFIMNKLIGDTVPMLDLTNVFDGITYSNLIFKADATPVLDTSAFSPYPARLMLMPARLGVVQTASSLTTTADTKNHPVYVGTQIAANRKDVLENTLFTVLKTTGVGGAGSSLSTVTISDPDSLTVLLRAKLDQATFDRFDPAPALDNSTFSPYPARTVLLDAKRGLTAATELKTLDSFGDNAYSSVQVTYTSRDRDLVGSIDRALLTFTAGRILQELVTIGSGIDQRQSNLERISFFIDKRFDENQAYGQGQNLGPLMLDNFNFNDGLTFVYLQRETDAFTPGDNSAFSTFPARLMIMSARLGVNQAFSSTTVTADAKNHPVYIGTQIAANRKDVLENTFYTILKVADNGDRSTAISVVTPIDVDRPPQIFQKRAIQDSGTFDRFDPAPALDTSAFSPFPARALLLDAKRGLTGSVELKTIDSFGDNAYSSVQVTYTSRDRDIIGSIDRATLLLTTTRLFQELLILGSGIDQRQSTLERVSFFINKRFDENQDYGQGSNLGPLMLDNFSFNDGLTFVYLQQETDAFTAGTAIAIRVSGTNAEKISFVNLLTAKAGALTTVSSVNNTAASTDRLFVGQQYGSSRFSGDPLERLYYTMLIPEADAAAPEDRPFKLLLKVAKADDTNQRTHAVTIGTSSLGIRVSGQTSENISIQWLKTARRGVTGNVSFSTIGQTAENTISSVTVVRTADSLGDEVGALDSFVIGYGFGGVTRSFADLITIGSGIDQRQSTLERISFFIRLRIDETPAGGQGSNIGPTMLDDFSFNDGLTFTYLQRETDATPALDNSAFSPFPARLMIMSARRGVVTTISSITTTADAKNDPVYLGTQIAANRKDVLENTFYTILKVADNGDRSTAVSIVTMGSGFDQRQDTLENIRFTSLLRAKLDQGTFDRFDPAPALDTSAFSPYPQRLMLLDAKRGLTAATEIKTIDAPGDNNYSSVQVTYTSRDRDIVGSLDRLALTFTAGRILQELVTIGSDNGFRFQSTQSSETVKFFINKRFDETQDYGQGTNLGPLMLDNFSFNDGLTFTYLQRETDAFTPGDNSAFSTFPARLMIMSARRGLTVANSGVTVTADTKNDPVYVGTQITGTRYLAGDGLETFRNYVIKVADNGDRDTAISIVTALDANRFTVLLRAKLDQNNYDRFDPVSMQDVGTFSPYPARTLLLDAKRGVQSTTELKTIDGIGNAPYSSITVTYGSRERDVVGIIDFYNSTFFNGKSNFDTVTIGSDNGFRFQSTQSSETVKFFINKRFDETPDGGQGINIGPSMLDLTGIADGLNFVWIDRETDTVAATDASAFSPYPARLAIISARRGLTAAVSGVTVTADTKNDPVYTGTQITGTRYLAGDGLETFRNYLIKVADNGDRSTAISVVTMGSGIDQRQDTLERVSFTSLLRAKLDQNSYDRFDPVSIGSGILGIRVSDNQLENMNMLMLKSAKAGLQSTVSGTTVTAMGGDRLFVGQQYGTIRFSRDPMENISLVTLKTTGIGGGGTSFSVVASTDAIRPVTRYFLNDGVGQTFETAVLDEAKAINNYKPLNETSAVSDGSQVRDVQKSVLGDPNDINIVSSGGSLRNTSYADISYFAEDYVGDSRSIF